MMKASAMRPSPYQRGARPTGPRRPAACGRRDRGRRPGEPGRGAAPAVASRARSRATRVSSRARCMPRHTCGPWAKPTWRPTLPRRTSNRSGSANTAGSRLAPASETVTRSPRASGTPASSVSRVTYRSTTAAAGSRRSDSSTAAGEQRRLGFDERLLRRVREQVHERVRDHRLRRLDAAEQEHRRRSRPPAPESAPPVRGRGRDER